MVWQFLLAPLGTVLGVLVLIGGGIAGFFGVKSLLNLFLTQVVGAVILVYLVVSLYKKSIKLNKQNRILIYIFLGIGIFLLLGLVDIFKGLTLEAMINP